MDIPENCQSFFIAGAQCTQCKAIDTTKLVCDADKNVLATFCIECGFVHDNSIVSSVIATSHTIQ